MIIFPFAVKLIQECNLKSSFLMVSIISWWFEKRHLSAPVLQLANLLLENKIYDPKKITLDDSKKSEFRIPFISKSHTKSLESLIKLFELKDCSSIDCDKLVALINIILDNASSQIQLIFKDCNLSPLWKLFFDPLLIKQAHTQNNREVNQHVGKEKFIPTDGTWITVIWTDDRYAKHIN